VRRIGDLADLTNGFPFDSSTFGTDGIPLVRIRDLFLDDYSTYVSAPVPESVVLKDGDVVIGMDGDFDLAVWKRGPAALNQRMCLLRGRGQNDSRFLAYALPRHLKVVNDLTYATTVKHLSSFEVLAERIGVPPPADQRAIADFLDAETAHIDELVAAFQDSVDQLVARRRAIVAAAVFGKIPKLRAGNTAWSRTRLKFVCSAQAGAWGSDPGQDGVDVFCVRAADFDRVALRVSRDRLPSRSFDRATFSQLRLRPGDIILEKSGGGAGQPVGGTALFELDVDAVCSNFAARLRTKPGVVPAYLNYLLAALYWTGLTESLGKQTTGIANLDTGAYLATPIDLPEIEAQRKIVRYVDSQISVIDGLSNGRKRQIALLAERRQALITAAVTGQLEIPGVAA
jgi:type I restriction enzyme S subunit